MANREELALIRSARSGQPEAQLALGKRYLFGGAGLPQNSATALLWLERAAQQQCQEAWLLIGSHIPFETAQQHAVPHSLCIWYERAFDDGDLQAGLVLARLVREQAEPEPGLQRKANLALQAAAQAGLAEAQWLLAQQGVGSTVEATQDWTARAADGGVPEAQQALAEQAWTAGDSAAFLRWALPQARALQQVQATRALDQIEVSLLSRCALTLAASADADQEEVQQLSELAAQEGDKSAQLWLGLWFARMDADGARNGAAPGSANFKKAIRWLTQAGEQGQADAWYALSRIYLKPEFSQRSVTAALHYLERAAEMGHRDAQLECGANAWRNRREQAANDVRAVYWLQKAAAQDCPQALTLLQKIASPAAPAAWAQAAQRDLTRELANSHPFLAARIELAARFGLSRPEALLLDMNAADQEHCLLVDISASYGRSKRRLILLQSGHDRQALKRITRLFEDVDCGLSGPEGNYRQRLYRLKTLLPAALASDGGEPVVQDKVA
jgi:uncharacterized protein